jgi:hypothetical protein
VKHSSFRYLFRRGDKILPRLLALFTLIKVFHLPECALQNADLNDTQIGLNAELHVETFPSVYLDIQIGIEKTINYNVKGNRHRLVICIYIESRRTAP